MDTTESHESATAARADELHALLTQSLGDQRWFPAKGAQGELRPVARLELPDPLGRARVEVRLLALPTGGVLQVPLTLRDGDGDGGRPQDADDPPDRAVLGTLGSLTVRDGPHDPAFVRAWLAAATPADPHPRAPDARAAEVDAAVREMRVLEGEQSNTSVLLPAASPAGILKVFRVLTPGPSPDVEVPLALSSVGWTGVPRPLAWLAARWPDPRDLEGVVGHLGVLSELVPRAEDGFRLACERAAAGEDLGDLAEELGRTTAQMHRALRTALPVPDDVASLDRVADVLRERARAAFDAVPELGDRAAGVERVLGRLATVERLPPLQRVHGDYHLGQVLHSPEGWRVLDFEGEPQASAEERTRPDLALRDLAGMLRSLDYAAAVGHATSPAWVERARERLVAGYVAELDDAAHADAAHAGAAEGAGDSAVLHALELDKALYEVVYEARNRPDWQHIPLAGVDRLVSDPPAAPPG
ncbi:phosphotransferase [Cellulomonas sp. APG4]|uniref:maltokinase N-terminal cap-like domain-containing protein n=1 Tax=Cellulomonas sp. APG4 TaxID=1538656 RepID=UPI00137A54FC|nr:phosphotransferase [Cellulomonas sp. APG4]NCT90675.1 phosphotransferase [Cellulomonas sp. APG4]